MKMSDLLSSGSSKWRQRMGRVAKWRAVIKALFLMIANKRQRPAQAMRYFSLAGEKALERMLSAFCKTPDGYELLRSRPNLSEIYASQSSIDAFPAGSLGQWYVTFMTDFGLTEEPYRSIANEQVARLAHDPERAWFHLRVDTSHDIRHVLAGYGPERLGEFCLLSFRYGQIHHPGMAIVIFLSVLDLIFVHRCRGLMAVWEAYHRGRRARLLDLLPWEKCFAEPLAVHRANLGLTPPQSYHCPFAPDAYVRTNAQAQYGELGSSASANPEFEAI